MADETKATDAGQRYAQSLFELTIENGNLQRVEADLKSLKAMIADMKAFPEAKPVNAEELQRVTDGNIRGLPNKFETNGQVLGAIAAMVTGARSRTGSYGTGCMNCSVHTMLL